MTRIPEPVQLACDELIVCSECTPEVWTTKLPAGVWELRATHSEDCMRPEELVYV